MFIEAWLIRAIWDAYQVSVNRVVVFGRGENENTPIIFISVGEQSQRPTRSTETIYCYIFTLLQFIQDCERELVNNNKPNTFFASHLDHLVDIKWFCSYAEVAVFVIEEYSNEFAPCSNFGIVADWTVFNFTLVAFAI